MNPETTWRETIWKRPWPRRRGGFTLIELLVSMLISSLVIVVVAGMTYVGTQSYQATQNIAELGQSARSILYRITREIRGASAVTCGENQMTIIPAETADGPDQIRYRLTDGVFYCDRIDGADQESYALLSSSDTVSVQQFVITISTQMQDLVEVTTLVTVRLDFQAEGQTYSVTASACPRRNILSLSAL